MTHRLANVTRTFGVALGACFAALLLCTASAGAAPCFFNCRTTTTTTTSTSKSSSTVTTTTTTSTTATTTSPAPTGLPAVTLIPATSGTHGFAYDAVPPPSGVPGAPALDTAYMSAAGYVEQEYEMSGSAKVYQQSGQWSSNGDWSVSSSQSLPYTTRLLIRYPTNPAKFNGTVVFEWLNDTTGGDQDPVWAQVGQELINDGYAYVGVTAQTAGMSDLATWDPARYGALGDSNDGQSYDIFTQAAEVVKADSATLLGGLTPKVEIGTGDSQSAFRIDTYVNAIQPLTHAFTAFLGVGRAVVAAPIGNGLVALSPLPALIRTNNTAPFIQLNTQGDVLELQSGLARQPDNSDLRTWEVAGAAHIDAHEGAYETETIAREQPTAAIPMCVAGTPIEGTGTALDGINQPDNMPLYEVEDAAIAALQNWVVNGVPAPHEASYLSTTSLFGLLDLPNVNQYGVASGGIQLPEATVPTEDYSPINLSTADASEFQLGNLVSEAEAALQAFESGGITNPTLRSAGLCLLSGYFTDLGNSTLQSLYPTPMAYATKYDSAANTEEADGFLTPADAAAAIANANADVGGFQQPEVSIP